MSFHALITETAFKFLSLTKYRILYLRCIYHVLQTFFDSAYSKFSATLANYSLIRRIKDFRLKDIDIFIKVIVVCLKAKFIII
jgi:hypothetical protein